MDSLKRIFQSKEEKHRKEFENACKQCSALVKQRIQVGQAHWWEERRQMSVSQRNFKKKNACPNFCAIAFTKISMRYHPVTYGPSILRTLMTTYI